MLTATEINKLTEKIVQLINPEKVIVFGSYAKGAASYKSDLDLFIITDTHLPMKQRGKEIKPIIANLLVGVDIHVFTPEEVQEYGAEVYSFVHSILKTGKILYEKK